jgi:hypothetical protein
MAASAGGALAVTIPELKTDRGHAQQMGDERGIQDREARRGPPISRETAPPEPFIRSIAGGVTATATEYNLNLYSGLGGCLSIVVLPHTSYQNLLDFVDWPGLQ